MRFQKVIFRNSLRSKTPQVEFHGRIPLHRLWIINDWWQTRAFILNRDPSYQISPFGTPVTRFHLASQHSCECFWRNSGAVFKIMNTAKTLRWLFFSSFSNLSLCSSYTSLYHLTISPGCVHTWDNILFSCLTADSCLSRAESSSDRTFSSLCTP